MTAGLGSRVAGLGFALLAFALPRVWGQPPLTLPADLNELVGKAPPAAMPVELPWYPEQLIYDVKWGPVKAGMGTLAMTELVGMDGRAAFHIVSEAVSSRFVDRFHKVRDHNEAWLDAVTLRSLAYATHLREGNYQEDVFVLYDRANGRFVSRKVKKDGAAKESSGRIPPDVQDVLSALYYTRTLDLKVGGEYVVDVNTGENWPLLIKVLRPSTVQVPLGTFKCLVVQPVLRQQGIFIQKGHDMLIWMTDDSRKTPVHLEVEVFIGHISANLVRIQQSFESLRR